MPKNTLELRAQKRYLRRSSLPHVTVFFFFLAPLVHGSAFFGRFELRVASAGSGWRLVEGCYPLLSAKEMEDMRYIID
jgi:hypothetical protein